LNNTAQLYALPGGVSSMTEARYNELHTSFYQQLLHSNQFLTWHPLSKRTQAEYMQKLWYISHTAAAELHLKVKLNFLLNGSAVSSVIEKAVMGVNMFDLVEICCGFNTLQLANEIATFPHDHIFQSYDIFLTNENSSLISEIRNFYFDDRRTGFDRTFLFKNSFKLWETFIARGIQQIEPEYGRNQINKIKSIGFTTVNADKQNYFNQESNKLTVDTGWISLDEKKWLSELLLSTEVYEIVPSSSSGGIIYPVVITGTNKNPIVDKNFNHNVQIEYLRGYTEEHYSLEQSVIPLGNIPQIILANPVNIIPIVPNDEEIAPAGQYQQH
jgi:hypothetical protein